MTARTPEEGQYCVLSTGHVFPQDLLALANLANLKEAPVMVASTAYGAVISLMPSEEADVESIKAAFILHGLSPVFIELWEGMRSRCYGLMWIDADAADIAGYRVVQ